MLHLLIEQGVPVSHVVYFETEWDFPQMRAHLDLVTAKTGMRIIRVRYYRYFEEMLALWGWPKSAGGWCTACKHGTCLKYIGHIKGDKTEYKRRGQRQGQRRGLHRGAFSQHQGLEICQKAWG